MAPAEDWANRPEKPKPGCGDEVSSAPEGHPSLGQGDNPVFMRQGAYLPHWQMERGTYAVTFRLAGSLPKIVSNGLKNRISKKNSGTAKSPDLRSSVFNDHFESQIDEQIENFLDLGHGNCWLGDDRIASVVADSLRFFDGVRYRLHTWCIMPNHVHVLFEPFHPHMVSGILHSWKSFTAKNANQILQRQGPFWQAEYYDRLIRNWREFRHTALYILENPVKAGLKDWKWVWIRDGILDL